MQVPGPTAALKVSGSQASQMRTVLVCAPLSELRTTPAVFTRKSACVTVPFLSVAIAGSFAFAAVEGEVASTVSFFVSDFAEDCANPLGEQNGRVAPKPTAAHLMLCSFTARNVLTFIQISLRFCSSEPRERTFANENPQGDDPELAWGGERQENGHREKVKLRPFSRGLRESRQSG